MSSGIGSYIEASRWTVMTSRSALDVRAPQLRPRALAQVAEQGDELVRPVQADVLVADQVPERRDRLDVVADVRRRAVGAGVPVVDDRERAAARRGRGRGRGAGVGGDPRAHPLELALAVAPRLRVLAHVALEHREHLAGEVLVAVAEHRRRGSGTRSWRAPRADPPRRARGSRASAALGVDRQAGAHVLGGGVGEPGLARDLAQLLQRQRRVPSRERRRSRRPGARARRCRRGAGALRRAPARCLSRPAPISARTWATMAWSTARPRSSPRSSASRASRAAGAAAFLRRRGLAGLTGCFALFGFGRSRRGTRCR